MGCINSKSLDDEVINQVFQVTCIDKITKIQRHGHVKIVGEDLIFHKKGVPVYTWPLNKIRRYGFEDSMFCFECSSSCESGSGIFSFKTKNARNIFNCVHGKLLETQRKTSKEYQMKENLLLSINFKPTIKYRPERFNDLSDNNDEILQAITLPKATRDIPNVPESNESDYMEMTCGRGPALLPPEDKIIYTEVQIVSESTCPNYKPPEPVEKTEYVQIDFERTKLLHPLLFKCPDNSGLRRTRHDSTLSDDDD